MGNKTVIRSDFSEDGPLPPGIAINLQFLAGPLAGQLVKLYKKNSIIGRTKGDVVLKDNACSGRHAEITFDNGRVNLRDLGSTNGTLLNGAQVWEAILESGDEITIGGTVFKVEIKQVAASASWANLGMEAAAEQKPKEIDRSDTDPMIELEDKNPLKAPLPPNLKGGLQVTSGLDAGLKLVVKTRGVIIGRGGADLVLHDPAVSRKHCSIEFMSADRILLKDLRSMNGTYLNQKWTSVGNLKNGDVIKVGNSEVKFFVAVKG